MKHINHNKIKNTGILFELLLRQVTADILSDNKQLAANLVKKYFSSTKPLGKEIRLYQMLMGESFSSELQANRFIDEVMKSRCKLSSAVLRREKYNLIKEIRDNYPVEDFFRSKINNYKVQASISGLFLSETSQDEYFPTEIMRHRQTIVDHVLKDRTKKKKIQEQRSKEIAAFEKKDKDLRLLSYKILVDNFNSRYKNLNSVQKKLLKEYINNVSNTSSLKDTLREIVTNLKKDLKTHSKGLKDKVVKIKMNEALKSIDKFCGLSDNSKNVKDSYVLQTMRYLELLKELKRSGNKNKKVI